MLERLKLSGLYALHRCLCVVLFFTAALICWPYWLFFNRNSFDDFQDFELELRKSWGLD